MDQSIDLKSARDTRERLILGALGLFAGRGFEATSTRELARAAHVNLSAIAYHFGGKEGLYAAVVERVIEDMAPNREGLAHFIRSGLDEAAGDPARLAELARQVVRLIIRTISTMPGHRIRMQLLYHEIQQPSDHFAAIRERHFAPLQRTVGALVAAATGLDPADERTRIQAHMTMMLCVQFVLNTNLVQASLGWKSHGEAEFEKLAGIAGDWVVRALGLEYAAATWPEDV
ncbi:CerR family C-terminal domain-containing protein [Oceanibacterium hippocampi]|uniref:Putative HTH-type transcriptional regulator YttP n=1 Tax=Oceanibacterium hippocampi TaxID=745714 RepID=A0A1Y5RUP5_9PROT|nr:CerR family C-terminal domain-containing protein [Oceanibacterium hippocampi]SLN25544.1 putative HTH-type transcriptional regulator YttP [Oceanibacterium hippocampi]